jgi:hypothetical protein
MIALTGQMARPLAETTMAQEQLALALNRAGRGDEAESVLKTLLERQGPSSETCAILGRVYKRWESALKSGNGHSPANPSRRPLMPIVRASRPIAGMLSGDQRSHTDGVESPSRSGPVPPPAGGRLCRRPMIATARYCNAHNSNLPSWRKKNRGLFQRSHSAGRSAGSLGTRNHRSQSALDSRSPCQAWRVPPVGIEIEQTLEKRVRGVNPVSLVEVLRVPRRLASHRFSWKLLPSTEHPVVQPRKNTVLRLEHLQPAFLNRPGGDLFAELMKPMDVLPEPTHRIRHSRLLADKEWPIAALRQQ